MVDCLVLLKGYVEVPRDEDSEDDSDEDEKVAFTCL